MTIKKDSGEYWTAGSSRRKVLISFTGKIYCRNTLKHSLSNHELQKQNVNIKNYLKKGLSPTTKILFCKVNTTVYINFVEMYIYVFFFN